MRHLVALALVGCSTAAVPATDAAVSDVLLHECPECASSCLAGSAACHFIADGNPPCDDCVLVCGDGAAPTCMGDLPAPSCADRLVFASCYRP